MSYSPVRRVVRTAAAFFLLVSIALVAIPANQANAVATGVSISTVYGGGGASTGSPTYKNDYIELFNLGASSVNLNGLSVQYAAAAGTTWQVTALPAFSLAAGQYFLVQEGTAGSVGATLPPADATGSINMSATAGKVGLVSGTSAMTGACGSGPIIDFVGYGSTASCSETSPTVTLDNAHAAQRTNSCTDTDNNSSDFSSVPNATARNTGTLPLTPCGGDAAPSVSSTVPTNGATNVAITSNITVTFSEPVNVAGSWFTISGATSGPHTAAVTGGPTTFTLDPDSDFVNSELVSVNIAAANVTDQDATDPPDNMAADYPFSFTTISSDTAPTVTSTTPTNGAGQVPVNSNIDVTFSEPVNVTASAFTVSGNVSGANAVNVTGGPTTFTLDPGSDFVNLETVTVTVVANQITDQDANDPPDNMAANYVFAFGTPTRIHDIQGAAHLGPLAGRLLTGVPGIVTAKRSNGFYYQDTAANYDADDATSEAVFVFTSLAPAVSVGDDVSVSGTPTEFRAGGASSASLTITEISNPGRTVVVNSSGNALPAPTVVGAGGRVPPNGLIEDDATGDVETSGTFDPASDGIDFWESLEDMRVQLNDAHVVGPTSDFGSNREVPVVGDNGAGATILTARGGILLRQTDNNSERIILNDVIVGGPTLATTVDVGDSYPGATVGVIDYNFNNFKLEITSIPALQSNDLTQEVTSAPGSGQLSVGSFNVENLDPNDGAQKFSELANELVNNMLSPDIVALEELQDNNGATNDSVVDASTTINMLIAAIQAAGGPTYDFRQINPVDDQDGGEPGGNIRVAFLFRTDRGVSFVDRPGGTSTAADAVVAAPGGPQLLYSPGRIAPTDSAWNSSRKPLAGEFMYGGTKLFVIANHFNSKGGDQALWGHFQPPVLSSEAQRINQATLVHDFTQSILSLDPNANVIVLGDLNDFTWSNPLSALTSGGVLQDLVLTLPEAERYSYVFQGNTQELDHLLASPHLASQLDLYDAIHVNAEFAPQVSDHDPLVALFGVEAPITCQSGYGTPGNDTIIGTPGPDHICSGAGNDTVTGIGGRDIIEGGSGDDTLNGGSGDDHVIGMSGADDLIGGSGVDDLDGGHGDDHLDTVDGVNGNDTGDGGKGLDSCTGDPGDVFTHCP